MTAARAMVQAQGYNSLSFRELAKQIGIKSASVHYYFPTKGDLGAALAREYTDEFRAYLDGLVDAGKDWQTCIRDYADVFRQTLLRDNRMCLGGILAAERPDLALEVRAEVERFTAVIADWVRQVLSSGNPGWTRRRSSAGPTPSSPPSKARYWWRAAAATFNCSTTPSPPIARWDCCRDAGPSLSVILKTPSPTTRSHSLRPAPRQRQHRKNTILLK